MKYNLKYVAKQYQHGWSVWIERDNKKLLIGSAIESEEDVSNLVNNIKLEDKTYYLQNETTGGEEMNKLKINGIARGQYEQLCPSSVKSCETEGVGVNYKIRRAVDLGEVVYTYSNGCKVVRYYYLNLLVNDDEVMTIWKDVTRDPVEVEESLKQLHKELVYVKKYNFNDVQKLVDKLVAIN